MGQRKVNEMCKCNDAGSNILHIQSVRVTCI